MQKIFMKTALVLGITLILQSCSIDELQNPIYLKRLEQQILLSTKWIDNISSPQSSFTFKNDYTFTFFEEGATSLRSGTYSLSNTLDLGLGLEVGILGGIGTLSLNWNSNPSAGSQTSRTAIVYRRNSSYYFVATTVLNDQNNPVIGTYRRQ